MSGEIVTRDLGDRTYEHTYSIETYYLSETIISPVVRPAHAAANSAYHLTGEPLGQYEPYRLSQCV